MATTSESNTQLAQLKSRVPSQTAPRLNIIAAMLFLFPVILGVVPAVMFNNPIGVIAGVILGLLLAQSPKVAKQWEKAIVLRLGRYVGFRGPGLFWIVPLVESCPRGSISGRSPPVSRPSRRSRRIPCRSTSTRCSSGWSTIRRKPRWKCRTISRR